MRGSLWRCIDGCSATRVNQERCFGDPDSGILNKRSLLILIEERVLLLASSRYVWHSHSFEQCQSETNYI